MSNTDVYNSLPEDVTRIVGSSLGELQDIWRRIGYSHEEQLNQKELLLKAIAEVCHRRQLMTKLSLMRAMILLSIWMLMHVKYWSSVRGFLTLVTKFRSQLCRL